MSNYRVLPLVGVLCAVSALSTQHFARADTFGSGTNAFTIDFVTIGNAGNAADTTGYGAVPYEYRVGTYEISQDIIHKATANGLADVTAPLWPGNRSAANLNWYEAAAFANWLNTSTGRQAAYNLVFAVDTWIMALWNSADAWQLGGENLYRHKDAYYFLPSENEWYKAAYYNPSGIGYFLYPTASDTVPSAVASGTGAGTAVFAQPVGQGPSGVDDAGAASPYGTMGQGGNIWEWNETAFDGTNSSTSETRVGRGGSWVDTEDFLRSSYRADGDPLVELGGSGFRVASVPEPSTYALLAMTGVGALYAWGRRRRSGKN